MDNFTRNIIINSLRDSLEFTINEAQRQLQLNSIYILNQDIINELSQIASDSIIINKIAASKNISYSEVLYMYFKEITPIPIEIPFVNETPLLTNVFIGNLGNDIHLECDVFLKEMSSKIAETQLRVRYYKDGVEDISKLSYCSLIADDGGGLQFPNPLYGQEGQPQYVGDYTLAMILIDNGIRTFKDTVILMIRMSLQRIVTKCGYE